jgi:lipopolysaccharide transport protein LptA
MRFVVALFAVLAATPGFAQQALPAAKPASNTAQNLGLGKHDKNAPIHLASNSFASDVKVENGDYVGNVIVTQGDMKMRADRMHFDTTNGDVSVITAFGNVVVNAPNGTGTGDKGVYDITTHLITMTGKVVLTKKKDVMRGTKLVMDLTTNLAHLTADSSQGGRVTAVFIPKQQGQGIGTDGASAPKPQAAPGK